MSYINEKYNNLAKNTIIFAIGTFGSKALQFLIVPLYTYILTTEEYGEIDIFSTTISLVLPFITLLIQEALIRFLTAKEVSQVEAVNSGMAVFIASILLSIMSCTIYSHLLSPQFTFIFLACLVLNSYISIFQNYLKAIGMVTAFSICGILNTVTFLVSNFVMLLGFNMGIRGYLYSMLLSELLSACYITIRGGIISKISLEKIHLRKLKVMLMYSIPLIPNNLMWWIMNAGDKYIINYFFGVGANGLYSVSTKLPTLITTLFSIFMQAWQLSAIEEKGKEQQAEFYSRVYAIMLSMLVISTSLIIVLTKLLFSLVIGDEFFSAHLYSPLLCVATVLNCIATFAGVTYVVSKKTKKAFITTLVGAVTNIIANFVLIKPLGLTGVAIGTVLGYVVVLIFRVVDTKKEIPMNFDGKRSIISILLLFVTAIIYVKFDNVVSYVNNTVCFIVVLFLYYREFKTIIWNLYSRIKMYFNKIR